MKILVNYAAAEKAYLPILSYYIKVAGHVALSSSKTFSISELVDTAKTSNCQGIFLVNTETLRNCVPGLNPSLDLYRGSRLDFSVPVIVGNSLAQINTIDHGKFVLETDLAKFKQLDIKTNKTFSFEPLDRVSLFNSALEILKTAIFIAYDIETVTVSSTGIVQVGDTEEESDSVENGTTVITCASYTAVLPDRSMRTFVLPFFNFMECHWMTEWEFGKAVEFLRTANALDIPKCMHNGMYDCLHSIVYRAWPRNFCLDTMAMMHSQYSSLPKSLDFVASIVLPDYYQWKPQAKEASKNKDINQYWGYNAKDTFYTARICMHYLQHMPLYARYNYASQFKLVYPALYCGFEGFLVDNNKRKDLRAAREVITKEMLRELQVITDNVGFNPGSPKQVQELLYHTLGAADPHIGYKKTNGRRSRIVLGTDAKNLAAIGEQHPILFAVTDRITKYRESKKAIGTYFDFIQKEGRLLYHINPFGTETSRMSAKKSNFWCGTQIQNIPFYAKEMLIADPGYILCEPDNSQSEARCTAYLAQDMALIEALETPGKDFYKTLGTLFFGIPYEEVTTEFRNNVLKKIVHGTNYMMGGRTFIENAGLDNILFAANVLKIRIVPKPEKDGMTLLQFTEFLLEKYHQPFKRIRAWYKEVKHEIETTHRLVSPLGHTRYFFGDIPKKYQIFASGVAHGPQNLSVSILNIGWWKQWLLQKEEPIAFRMKAQIHDSAPFQYLERREDIRDRAIECFRNPVEVHGRTLVIPVDYKYGKDWGHMKKGV